MSEYFLIPSLKVKSINTAGAGDAFNGGLVAGLIYYKFDLLQALNYATVVAALSTTKEGTAPAMPRQQDVLNYIENKEKAYAVH